MPEVVESQPVAGALPPVVFTRWTYVTSLNTPVPVFDVARSSSHGIASESGQFFLPDLRAVDDAAIDGGG